MTYLYTDSGQPIETDGGQQLLLVQNETNTDDIQLFDFSVNLLQAILWQYNNAQNLQGLLNAKSQWYWTNQSEFWYNWIQNVFDLRTANQFGLIVWSIILDFPIYVNTGPPSGPIFGFDGSGGVNFDNGILGAQNGQSYVMPIDVQRIALQLRYYQLISSGTVPEINRFLKYVFGSYGPAYLIDYHDMTQTYVFGFPVSADLAYLFNNFDILPRPAGVLSTWVDSTNQFFGFDGSGGVNFDNGILVS